MTQGSPSSMLPIDYWANLTNRMRREDAEIAAISRASQSGNASSAGSYSNPLLLNSPQSDWSLQLSQLLGLIGNQQLDWARTQVDRGDKVTTDNINRFLAAAEGSQGMANTLMGQYQDKFAPLMDNYARRAQTYGSEQRKRAEMGRAESTVAQAAKAAQDAAENKLQSFGVNPNSGRYQDLTSTARIQDAAARAGAGTEAARKTEETGNAMLGQASQMGMNLPGVAVNAMNAGYQGLSGAQNSWLGQQNANVNMLNSAVPFYNASGGVLKLPQLANQSESWSGSGPIALGPDGGPAVRNTPLNTPVTPGPGQVWNRAAVGAANGGMIPAMAGGGPVLGGAAAKYIRPRRTSDIVLNGGIVKVKRSKPLPDPDEVGRKEIAAKKAYDAKRQAEYDSQFDKNGNLLPEYGGRGYGPGGFSDQMFRDQGYQGGLYTSDMPYQNDGSYMDAGYSDMGGGGYSDMGGGTPWDVAGGYASGGMVEPPFAATMGLRDISPDVYASLMAENPPQRAYARGGSVLPTTGGHVPRSASPSQGRVTDDVPARLNAGEYVIPKDVVAFKGQEFFRKLIETSRRNRTGMPGPEPKAQIKPGLRMNPTFVSQDIG